MKWIKECPLAIAIAGISLILSVVAFVLKDSVYADYSAAGNTFETPMLALVFRGLDEGRFPWSEVTTDDFDEGKLLSDTEDDGHVDPAILEGKAGSQDAEDTDDAKEGTSKSAEAENAGQKAESDDPADDESLGDEDAQTPENPEDEQFPEITEYSEVDDDYFNDALFIGDSRTVGLSEYCEALDTRATFYSKVSLTIFDCMSKEFIKTDEGKINIETALTKNQFKKIYIMLGLNEIGTGNEEYFIRAYVDVLHRIEDLQPDAIIYIQGIMHVTEHKSSSDKNCNNAKINLRNKCLSEICDNRRVFYLDMNEAVDDGKGNLNGNLSFDDVHLKASAYELWHEFLLQNAAVR